MITFLTIAFKKGAFTTLVYIQSKIVQQGKREGDDGGGVGMAHI